MPGLPEFLYQLAHWRYVLHGYRSAQQLPGLDSISAPIRSRICDPQFRPADPDGLVIIYRLQPNRRYEAIKYYSRTQKQESKNSDRRRPMG